MTQTVNVNFKLDADVKESIEKVCADSFYSDSNMEHLRRGVAALNAGKGVAHEIIEDEDVE